MANIHPSAVIDKSAKLADDIEVGPNCVIAGGVEIGRSNCLEANVVIGENVKIGNGNSFFPNCTVGGRPQILGLGSEKKIGGLLIGDNNTIREQVTIHPSMYPDKFTSIGSDNLLMIGVHIGHDCILEDKIIMSNYAQISGHCIIGTGVWLSGMVLLHQFVTIGQWCYAAGLAGINHDVPPYLIVSGHYPPRVRGVNRKGLERAGLSQAKQAKIIEAYKRLYRRNETSLLEKAKSMAVEDGLDENVKAMVDVIIKSGDHRFGRHLETLRH